MFRKLKDNTGSFKEILTDNVLLIIVAILIALVLIPIFRNNTLLVKDMRNYQINHEKKIEIK